MKYFKCTVCGYIHYGDQPPERCPVCKAPREKFVELAAAEGKDAYDQYLVKMGDRLPAILATAAAELAAEKAAAAPAEVAAVKDPMPAGPAQPAAAGPEPKRAGVIDFLFRQMSKNHAHPIAAHFPNGILPMAVLFLIVSSLFGDVEFFVRHFGCMPQISFYCLVFVVVAMPGVLFSGYVDWQERYGGAKTRIIITKIICGSAVLILGVVIVVLRLILVEADGVRLVSTTTFILLHLLMLGFVAYAGHLGGKLVFKD